VSGADPIDMRPGFAAMLERIEGNGVRTIIVETASRFARDLMVQEVGHAKLRERGIDLSLPIIPARSLTPRQLPSWCAEITGSALSGRLKRRPPQLAASSRIMLSFGAD
jgi:hypothetical protein